MPGLAARSACAAVRPLPTASVLLMTTGTQAVTRIHKQEGGQRPPAGRALPDLIAHTLSGY